MTNAPSLEILQADAVDVLKRLPEMGKIMVILRSGGATHERIGPVGAVLQDGAVLHISGDCHDAVIPLHGLNEIRLDRSSVMKEKVYPRLEFRNDLGETAFAVVGMEGLPPFEDALKNLPRGPADPAEKPAKEERGDLDENDPARSPFAVLEGSGIPVTITAQAHGVQQKWQGAIEAVKPSMGFLNIMTTDFHLHLEGGSVSSWLAEPGSRKAIGVDGRLTGLSLTSEAFA